MGPAARWSLVLAWSGLFAASLPPPATAGGATFPPHLVGNATAAYGLLERVLPGSSAHFELFIAPACPGVPTGKACFTLADGSGGRTKITGTTASEITGGVGVYLREHCGMTIGWARGGGSRVFMPSPWPKVGAAISQARSVPYSHVTQVCTHSYTLVWYDWAAWEIFIDWMALAVSPQRLSFLRLSLRFHGACGFGSLCLSFADKVLRLQGHNSIVAPTGQEEVQYKVLTEKFGLSDMQVR